MVGFVQTIPSLRNESYTMTNHKVVCFYGQQETHYDMEKTVSVKTESDTVKVAVITSQNKIIAQPDKMANKSSKSQVRTKGRDSSNRFNAHAEHKASDETDKAITFINNNDLGWKADVCKLQKHHADYGSHCEAQEKAHSLA